MDLEYMMVEGAKDLCEQLALDQYFVIITTQSDSPRQMQKRSASHSNLKEYPQQHY
jgi:beta-phosphoglucomutase-like phosphatase (HAD superfamily)